MIRSAISTASMLALACFLGTLPAHASVPFELPPALVSDTFALPRASAIGDIDGDGDLDIVVVDQSGGRVVWYENRLNEGLGWQAWPIDNTLGSPVAVALGDLTGNGYLDVVVSTIELDPQAESVAWYRNDGNPRTNNEWAKQVTATGLLFTQAIAIGDINGNGRNDIISAAARGQSGPFELVWFENVLFEGNTVILNVNARMIEGNLPGITSLAVGDINRNGRLEVAVSASFPQPGNQRRLIAYYEHGGNPAAGPWNQVVIDNDFLNAWRVLLVDLNGDGALDAVGTSIDQNRVTPFFNTNGNGTLWTPGATLSPARPNSIRAVDLNLNGSMDLLIGTQGAPGGDRVFWYENDGNGAFTERPIFSVGAEAQFQAVAGDVRGDGDPDIVVTRAIGATVSLIENATIHRNAVFNKPATPVASTVSIGGVVLAADLNRDGQPDILASSPEQGVVRWWANGNDGANWTGSTISASLSGAGPLAVGDLSSNGFLEVVAAAPASGRVDVFLAQNATATSWTGVNLSASYTRVSDVAVADVRGNGRLDVIAASPDSALGDIVWFENQTGSGTNWGFPQVILPSQPGAPASEVQRRIAVGDLNRSGRPDVVSGLTGTAGLAWHRNEGNGVFTTLTVDAAFALMDRPVVADVTRDGALDIIAVGRAGGGPPQLAWFRNENGDGSSWQREQITSGTGVFGILAVADFTQDGLVDILARTPFPRLFANLGDGDFQPQTQSTLDLAGRVAVADFDRSGDLDIAGLRAGTGDANGRDLGWFENAGGQYAFRTQDFAAPALAENAMGPLLGITALHRGREGDSDIQLTSLALRFEHPTGTPYSSADLGALLASISLYLDDGDVMFDPGSDTLLDTISSFTLVDGVMTINIDPNDTDFRFGFDDEPTFWVVATAQPDGSTALPTPRFRVVHLTENSSTAIDAASDLPVSAAFTPNVASAVTQVIDPATTPLIFLLGANPLFWEAGDTPYVDPGAEVDDPAELDPVLIGPDDPSIVDVNTLGSYALTFNYSNLGPDAPEVTRIVHVVDNTPPVITLAGNASVTVEAGMPYDDLGATALDSFEGNLTDAIVVTNPVNTGVLGVYTVRYNVSDSSGNAAIEVTRTVTVEDTLPPVIDLIGGDAISAEAGQPFVEPGFTAFDLLEGDLASQVVVTGAVDTNTLGDYVLQYDVEDSSGNQADTVFRTVTVEDTTPPVITRTGDASVTVEAGTPYTDLGATALDSFEGNLTGAIIVTNPVDTNTLGVYTVRYNVSDSSGNAAVEVTRTVTVADTIPPVITLTGDAEVTIELGDPYNDDGATALDSFEGNLTANIIVTNPVDTDVPGVYIVRYNVSDSSGNAALEVTRTVTVVDPTLPVITRIGPPSVTAEAGEPYSDLGATAVDNLGNDLTADIVVTNPVNTGILGVYTVRYNVTDSVGKEALEVTRTVTVVDTTPPVITLIGAAEITIQLGDAFTDPGATALDSFEGNLSGAIVVTGAVDTNTLGSYTLRYNVSDSSGNDAEEVVRTVIVEESFDSRDINRDGLINAVDVQLVINGALGLNIEPFNADVNGDGLVNAVDVQQVINGALGL